MDWISNYSIGRLAELGCLLEVTASKPGNVHRGADFEDLTYLDFTTSAIVLGQAIDDCTQLNYGATVLEVARRTMMMVGTNTNLGINLLVCAMAKAINGGESDTKRLTTKSMDAFVQTLDQQDASDVYEAIRLMNPSGLGKVEADDVHVQPNGTLIEAMFAAKDRDLIAAQFTNGFADVFDRVLPSICEGRLQFESLMRGVVWAHVKLMAEIPDSLIARKNGEAVAIQSQVLAQKCIDSADRGPEPFFDAVSNLDFWLRSDGHKRNPGTTADLIAASLFAGLVNGELSLPLN